jgi:hypothetical protein
MIKLFSIIYESIMPSYSPEGFVTPLPKSRELTKPTKPILPDNVKYSKSFQNLVRETWDTSTNTVTLSVYKIADKNADKFKDELTNNDLSELQLSELDPLKATRLKPLWAKGLTSEIVAADISRTERGYSWREVKKYWSVFNRAAEIENEDPKASKPLPRKPRGAKKG